MFLLIVWGCGPIRRTVGTRRVPGGLGASVIV